MNKIMWLIFLSIVPFNVAKAETANAPVVLELFTSQSCSSCPPADKILGELTDTHDNVIALSCNVTYWNHLHWKDTLSKNFCTARQRGYVQALKSRGPYTPQIIINGKYEMVGSRERTIKRTINNETKNATVKLITINLEGNDLEIILPEVIGSDNYKLLLVPHGTRHTQSIPSGENKGRIVNYTNPVEAIISLGTWGGKSKSMSYDILKLNKAHGYVILAQKNGQTGNIVAAGKLKL
jgi:hypothetical protein